MSFCRSLVTSWFLSFSSNKCWLPNWNFYTDINLIVFFFHLLSPKQNSWYSFLHLREWKPSSVCCSWDALMGCLSLVCHTTLLSYWRPTESLTSKMSLTTILSPGCTTPWQGTATAHPGWSASFVNAPPTPIPPQSVLKAPSWKVKWSVQSSSTALYFFPGKGWWAFFF